ncbi:hypothetical protein DPMN_104290 [Dreissena polymorpha]|uniref:Uncharacterized protein n=1 Tax=Dreissena polymorpha TaxID=45954 RepID=A0A9D4H7H1_DREPO|nr:hypothetical protein DPMN_104290 [Dreissena polymorpha]
MAGWLAGCPSQAGFPSRLAAPARLASPAGWLLQLGWLAGWPDCPPARPSVRRLVCLSVGRSACLWTVLVKVTQTYRRKLFIHQQQLYFQSFYVLAFSHFLTKSVPFISR